MERMELSISMARRCGIQDGLGPPGGRIRIGQVGTKTHWTETQSCSNSILSQLRRLGVWTPILLEHLCSFTLIFCCSLCSKIWSASVVMLDFSPSLRDPLGGTLCLCPDCAFGQSICCQHPTPWLPCLVTASGDKSSEASL